MTESHTVPDDQIRVAFQRWRNLEEEKARIADDLKELFAEQKAFGHDTKAMRAAFRLKVKIDEARPEDVEHEALVDTYLAALEAPRVSRAYARENIEKIDREPREVRAARRTSEAMDDTKALSAEAAALGLIDPAAHAETVRIADAIARKYGAGVVDPETGEVLEDEFQSGGRPSAPAELAPRLADESGVSISPETATRRVDDLGSVQDARKMSTDGQGDQPLELAGERLPINGVTAGETASELQMDRDGRTTAEPNDAMPAEKGREAIPDGPEGADLSHAGASGSLAADERDVEATVEQRSSASDFSGSSSGRASGFDPDDAGSIPAPETIPDGVPAFLTQPNKPLRPHCLNPGDGCAGYGDKHCHSCLKAMKEEAA